MASAPEMRFLALCLPRLFGDSRDLTKNLPVLDWSALLAVARWQGMLPLLASHLLTSSAQRTSSIPASVIAELSAYQNRHLFVTLTQTAALRELQREFDRATISVLPWKGSSMAMLVYGAATLRESVDLDFLFLEQDIQKVLQITRVLGYRLLGTSESESKDIYILTSQREFTFVRKRDRLILEFHLQVLPGRFTLWQDSQADIRRASTLLPLADVTLRLQNPEDLLISLCAHATKHNWDRLKWSCDIAQFLRVYGAQIEWKVFLLRLHEERKDGAVLLGLALSAIIFAVELPVDVERALQRKPELRSLTEELAAHLMTGSDAPVAPQHQKAILALLCPRLRDRIAYRLLPIVELNYEDLYIPVHNRAFFFLNYALRVVRLLRKYGPRRLAAKTAASVRAVR